MRVTRKNTGCTETGSAPDPASSIEIVVHHDLEEPTLQKYKQSGIPVIRAIPTWETVTDFLKKTEGHDPINIPATRCKNWKRRITENDQILKEMIPQEETDAQITPITHDLYGSPLKLQTKNTIMTHAKGLVRLEFKHQESRTTPFLFQSGKRKIYADLDSTEVMGIWQVNCEPAI